MVPVAVIFRFAEERDAAAVQAVYAPYCESTPISFELTPPSVEEMAQRMRQLEGRLPWLVCEHEGRLAGYVYASRHRERAAYQWSVDVTVYLAAAYHRQGIGRGLYTSLFSMLVLQGYYQAFAGITLPNPASVGLHQSVGFQRVGIYRNVGFKMGRWYDVVWLQRPLQPETPDPAPPRPLAEIRSSPEVEEALRQGLQCVRIPALS
jgi:phosphinothricin acetyltransferase